MNIDRCGRTVGRATWVDDGVVEAVSADEVRRWCVSERAVGVDHNRSTLVGRQGDRTGSCCFSSRIKRRDDVAVWVAIVGTDRRCDRCVRERFEVIVLGDRRRVVHVGCCVDHVDGQFVFDAVAVFIQDFDRHGVFADEISWRRVGVRAVWVDFQFAAIVGRDCGRPGDWVSRTVADG